MASRRALARIVCPSSVALLLVACSGGGGLAPDAGGGDGGTPACAPSSGTFAVAGIIKTASHPCRQWVDSTYGRVGGGGGGGGSAVIWSRLTPFQTGVMVSAAHVLAAFGTDAAVNPATLSLDSEMGGFWYFGKTAQGAPGGPFVPAGTFPIFHPEIPAAETADRYRHIQPRHDFFLAVVDRQQLPPTDPPPRVGPVVEEPLPLYDPAERTLHAPTFADAVAGAPLLLLGIPAAAGVLTGSVGQVLTDDEAREAITWLATQADEEGDIPYDPPVEAIVRGEAAVGMSGGGAFDGDGRLVGLLVRATQVYSAQRRYVRIVRMPFIVAQLNATYQALTDDQKARVAPFLEPPPP